MKKLYTTIIFLGIISEIVILIYLNKKYIPYGPIIFWAIGLFGMLHYGTNLFNLSEMVKKSKPELYQRHSFGNMLTRAALANKDFLSKLNMDELKVIERNKIIFKYILLCFVLFAFSVIPVVFSLYS